jgi:hypothetical protein
MSHGRSATAILQPATSLSKKPQSNGRRTDQAVGSGVLLASFSVKQKPSDFSWIISHVAHRDDGGHLGLYREEYPKVAPANDRSPKEAMLPGKHLRIPLDPGHSLAEAIAKPRATIHQP